MAKKAEKTKSRSEKRISLHGRAPGDPAAEQMLSSKYQEPYYCDKTAPCNEACPAGEDVVEYIYLASQGRLREAWELIRQENPFPGVCGRVCHHPCEGECNREELGGVISIHALERFLADYGRTLPRPRPKARPQRTKQVAIVGSGPAGLSCAYQLARMRYGVTVFEALPKAGGMMRAGIPRYRLPRAVLNQEIADIKAQGVEIRTNTVVGQDIALNQLRSFEALFIATGFHQSGKLGLPGEEAKGVFSSVELLKRFNLGQNIRIGERVVIIGGGNASIHIARSLLRLGCRPIIVCRYPQTQMPANGEEIADVLEEGIEIIPQVSPESILVQGGRVKGMELVRVKSRKTNKSGHGRQLRIKGSNFLLKADGIVLAMEELPDLTFLPEDIKTEPRGILVDRGCFTSKEGVFAGGDVATGAGTVAHAIGSGKRAALAIDRYMKGEDFFSIPDQPGTARICPKEVDPSVVRCKDLNLAYFEEQARVPLRVRSVETRTRGFQEVCPGYKEAEAVAEAQRCLSCGVCNMCENCLIFCPDIAISSRHGKFGYKINYEHCTGCGICVQECPRNAMSIR
jgi:NADPH-dependent glutamate synthase beta subunit-like oxidoreductase/Pyruvate/2-oxoacid:ferredoxin oxidoreductase delta subunit